MNNTNLIFPEEKIRKLKKLSEIKNKDIFNILGENIKEAINSKLVTSKKIYDFLKEIFGDDYNQTYQAFNYYLNKVLNEEKEDKVKEKKIILFANDKGGVGKTTLATLLNLSDSLILNLDKTREIAHIYPYKRIADFGTIEKMENIDVEDYLHLLQENEDIDYIIIDTKGGITTDLIKVLPYVDSVIVPIKIGSLSEEPSYGFIVELKSAFNNLNNENVKWAIVYNDVSPKFLKKVGIAKYKLLDEFKEMEKVLKDEVLGDNLKVVTYFKRSEAITTREKEKKDIDELMKINFGAYLPIKNEINRLNKELESVIK